MLIRIVSKIGKSLTRRRVKDMKRIQEFSNEELVEELMGRFDEIVIVARKVLTNGDKASAERMRWWQGDMDACAGLTNGILMDILHKQWGINQDDIRI